MPTCLEVSECGQKFSVMVHLLGYIRYYSKAQHLTYDTKLTEKYLLKISVIPVCHQDFYIKKKMFNFDIQLV